MSIFVIGDENTVLGFSLVGVEGETVESVEEARSQLDEALDREGVQIVLITENWAAQMREEVNRLKMESVEPLVLEIQGGEHGPSGPSLRELVRQAVGVRLTIDSER
ncbi:MAG: V-type ATP synthase subunit F [Candidatus Promineifilaceae bacterium]|nr:V-type ATP synthase subunit F [Candidatus Promineifilaceae bacterium]